jgi:hypothetical protein
VTATINIQIPAHLFRRLAHYAQERNQNIETAIMEKVFERYRRFRPCSPQTGVPQGPKDACAECHSKLDYGDDVK